jgi:hypothetical protein
MRYTSVPMFMQQREDGPNTLWMQDAAMAPSQACTIACITTVRGAAGGCLGFREHTSYYGLAPALCARRVSSQKYSPCGKAVQAHRVPQTQLSRHSQRQAPAGSTRATAPPSHTTAAQTTTTPRLRRFRGFEEGLPPTAPQLCAPTAGRGLTSASTVHTNWRHSPYYVTSAST